MPKQKQLLLPIDGLEVILGGLHSANPNNHAKVINFKCFKNALLVDSERAEGRCVKDDLYQHAKKFTSYYKIFG